MYGSSGVKRCPACGALAPDGAANCTCGFSYQAPPPTGFAQPSGFVRPTGYSPQVVDQNRWIIALLLVIFLGHLGIHRFYMGYTVHGIVFLALQVVGWATACILIGFLFIAAAAIWWLVDLILIASNGLKFADGTPLR